MNKIITVHWLMFKKNVKLCLEKCINLSRELERVMVYIMHERFN